MIRDLLSMLQEAFGQTDVESSHIQSIEHNGEHLYVHFLNGSIYEYDGVTEEQARRMLHAPSKGRFLWQHIRDRYPYRKVTSVPQVPEQNKIEMEYDSERDEWVQKPQAVQGASSVPVGYQFRAPDGDNYIWKGAQWVNTRTGRIAQRQISQKITSIATRLIALKGE